MYHVRLCGRNYRSNQLITGRLLHGYRKTHRFSKMGNMDMGTVLGFGTPWHTVVSQVNYSRASVIFTVLNLVFSNLFSLFFQKVHFVTL